MFRLTAVNKIKIRFPNPYCLYFTLSFVLLVFCQALLANRFINR